LNGWEALFESYGSAETRDTCSDDYDFHH
jgi:hypothetical protein